jgi:hypothetical protein
LSVASTPKSKKTYKVAVTPEVPPAPPVKKAPAKRKAKEIETEWYSGPHLSSLYAWGRGRGERRER